MTSTFKDITKNVIDNLKQDRQQQIDSLQASRFINHKTYHQKVMRIQTIQCDIVKLQHRLKN